MKEKLFEFLFTIIVKFILNLKFVAMADYIEFYNLVHVRNQSFTAVYEQIGLDLCSGVARFKFRRGHRLS
jgi:hypothetical protein